MPEESMPEESASDKTMPDLSNPLTEHPEPHSDDVGKNRSIWSRTGPWKKATLVKNTLGFTWDEFLEIAIEQLMASGLVDADLRAQLRALSLKHGCSTPADSYWRLATGIGEPWGEAAATQRRINEMLGKINDNVAQLAANVETHAIAMMETGLFDHQEYDEE